MGNAHALPGSHGITRPVLPTISRTVGLSRCSGSYGCLCVERVSFSGVDVVFMPRGRQGSLTYASETLNLFLPFFGGATQLDPELKRQHQDWFLPCDGVIRRRQLNVPSSKDAGCPLDEAFGSDQRQILFTPISSCSGRRFELSTSRESKQASGSAVASCPHMHTCERTKTDAWGSVGH